MTQVDVAIVGGGLVGASMAIALARSGRQVAVIEAASRQADHQPSYDDRTLVINAASLNILRHLGTYCPSRSARYRSRPSRSRALADSGI